MTSKLVHDDRNGHFACDFFQCEVMISSLVKVVGLQSRQKNDPFFHRHQEHSSRHGKVVQYTAVILLVILLICFDNGIL